MDVWDNTTTGNGCLDERVKFFVTTDGELKVTWCDTLHLEILGGVTGEFEDFGGKVLKDGGRVDGCGSTDTSSCGGSQLQMTMDTTDWELRKGRGGRKKRREGGRRSEGGGTKRE